MILIIEAKFHSQNYNKNIISVQRLFYRDEYVIYKEEEQSLNN